MAAAIADIVSAHLPVGLFEEIRIDNDDLDGTVLVTWLNSITIGRLRDQHPSVWRPIERGFTSGEGEELQSLIEEKESKLPAYRQKCAVAWLVIEEGGEQISSNLTLSELPLIRTRFDRVYLYQRLAHRCFLLNTTRP